jgi:hypothetical protein
MLDFSPSSDPRCWHIALLGSLSLLQICVVAILSSRYNGSKLLRCHQRAAAFPARLKDKR